MLRVRVGSLLVKSDFDRFDSCQESILDIFFGPLLISFANR
jgi:hypothetical protein